MMISIHVTHDPETTADRRWKYKLGDNYNLCLLENSREKEKKTEYFRRLGTRTTGLSFGLYVNSSGVESRTIAFFFDR